MTNSAPALGNEMRTRPWLWALDRFGNSPRNGNYGNYGNYRTLALFFGHLPSCRAVVQRRRIAIGHFPKTPPAPNSAPRIPTSAIEWRRWPVLHPHPPL